MSLLLLFAGAQVVEISVGGGGSYSRKEHASLLKEYRQLLEARRAQAAIAQKAKQLSVSKRKRALEEAASAAAVAIEAMEAAERAISVIKLTSLMEAAFSAVKVADSIKKANAVLATANAIIEEIEDEEAVMLLLH